MNAGSDVAIRGPGYVTGGTVRADAAAGTRGTQFSPSRAHCPAGPASLPGRPESVRQRPVAFLTATDRHPCCRPRSASGHKEAYANDLTVAGVLAGLAGSPLVTAAAAQTGGCSRPVYRRRP